MECRWPRGVQRAGKEARRSRCRIVEGYCELDDDHDGDDVMAMFLLCGVFKVPCATAMLQCSALHNPSRSGG